jgi:transposase
MQRGLAKKGRSAAGRSRGGLGTKIHAVCDKLGNPVKFLLTPGQTHSVTQAVPLLEGLAAEHVIADKGYGSEQVREAIGRQGATAVIPPRSNRKVLNRAITAERYPRSLRRRLQLVAI